MKNDMPNEHTHMTDSEWGRDMKVHRIIDAKLPLTWLLSSAAALVLALVSLEWSVAAQNNKLEQLIAQYSKIEQRLDARDRFGITQLVVEPDAPAAARTEADRARLEWVVQAEGVVRQRP